ncbi:alpha/beta fold hydrolase [Roseateles oligotrophus]|uniref:Proline iminopeptidase n=1 Tax=Roseateles oligotrophus TaxID=1769250 RepID=A0ABT2YD13_9BURK|nr:alpha/beta hydrolase [Roseateles oligotrophus]MCV2367914.1 alpha/beta hydrolase [Roseateles oligotrophus]
MISTSPRRRLFGTFALATAVGLWALLGSARAATPVDEEGFRRIGGIEQWVTIHGQDKSKPVLLFLHGGPGSPLSPFAKRIYGDWSRDFVLVQWDQRGAGLSFGRNPEQAGSSLTLERMVADGLELTERLQQQFGPRKVLLMGGSWGSVLGVQMAKLRPDLFAVYVGTAQLVSAQANGAASYKQTLALAEAAGDAGTVSALKAIGPPPHRDPRAFGVLRRAIRAYEAKGSMPAPRDWWQSEARYQSADAQAATEEGEEYSFLQFVGLAGDGILSKIDLPALGPEYLIPMHFIQGELDLLTPLTVTQGFVDSIRAPEKSLTVVPLAGHDPNPALIEAQHRLLLRAAQQMSKEN